jgi:D-3-phosphoglycerate dehydrogenase
MKSISGQEARSAAGAEGRADARTSLGYDPAVPTVLFLQDLGVERRLVEELLATDGLALEVAWAEAPAGVPPQDVAALVTINRPVAPDLLDRFPGVRFVAVAFTGYDAVDCDACRNRGIAVANAPGYATDSTAELTLGLALALLREIPRADREVRSGGWALERPGAELRGKAVGIVGTGAIGIRVTELFRAFGCRLFGWSRTRRAPFQELGGTYFDDLGTLFAEVDLVTLHVPHTPDTEGLIGAAELAQMKPSAFLVNTSRGKVIDQEALVAALRDGHLAGAALDVFGPEPLPLDHPLRTLPNVVRTPHLAFRTAEALERRARITVANLKAFFERGVPLHPVPWE